MDILSYLLGYESGKGASGGGSSADVRYVTFMSYDGSVEYGKKAVAVGDDCADPIARGVFSTPTRESTAQYNYAFAGWATTANGALNANWNKAVTEDRTVYATFAAILRYYTITYLDTDGSVLKTESLAYGSMPSYAPTKDGVSFGGWNPEPATVTGDASYTAKWLEKVTFANGSWADIVRVANAGEAKNYFAVGDTRTMNLGFATTEVMILGFDHDDLADGSGKAAISIGMVNTTTTSVQPASTGSGYRGNANLYNRFTTDRNNLPAEVKESIKTVKKKTTVLNGTAIELTTYDETLFPLGYTELGDTRNYPAWCPSDGSAVYEAVTKKLFKFNSNNDFWVRNSAETSGWCTMINAGGYMFSEKRSTGYMRYGFCI